MTHTQEAVLFHAAVLRLIAKAMLNNDAGLLEKTAADLELAVREETEHRPFNQLLTRFGL